MAMDQQKFLSDIQGTDKELRFAAWRAAGDMPAAVIPQLGKAAASTDPGIAKAAFEALTTLTHSVGKNAADPKRAAVVQGLLDLSAAGPLPVRAHALRLLSLIAGAAQVPAIAKSLASPELREEAIFAIQRIPGDASIEAILAAYKSAAPEFQPRLLAALGQRRAAQATELVSREMSSANPAIAIAAAKAFGRIGPKVGTGPLPDPAKLNAWQQIELMDSELRYAANSAKEGNADAIRVYKKALARPEEHYQCAGIIGLSKIPTPEAAALIMPLLQSPNSKVRITAANAWKSMAAPRA